MQAPKILPWVARHAGINERDALDAWRRALSEATVQAGRASGAVFHRLAFDRFVALAQARGGLFSAGAVGAAASLS